MKIFITHTDTDRVKDIIEKLVNAAGRSILLEKPELDKNLINKVVKAVKAVMSETMDTLLLGSTSTIVEFDIENAVGQSFENVVKLVKWDATELDNSHPESDDQMNLL